MSRPQPASVAPTDASKKLRSNAAVSCLLVFLDNPVSTLRGLVAANSYCRGLCYGGSLYRVIKEVGMASPRNRRDKKRWTIASPMPVIRPFALGGWFVCRRGGGWRNIWGADTILKSARLTLVMFGGFRYHRKPGQAVP